MGHVTRKTWQVGGGEPSLKISALSYGLKNSPGYIGCVNYPKSKSEDISLPPSHNDRDSRPWGGREENKTQIWTIQIIRESNFRSTGSSWESCEVISLVARLLPSPCCKRRWHVKSTKKSPPIFPSRCHGLRPQENYLGTVISVT